MYGSADSILNRLNDVYYFNIVWTEWFAKSLLSDSLRSHVLRQLLQMTRKLVLVAALCSLAPLCTAIDNGLGTTPPMAWCSWNQFHATITQEIIQSQVDAISARNRTVDGKLTSLRSSLGPCHLGS